MIKSLCRVGTKKQQQQQGNDKTLMTGTKMKFVKHQKWTKAGIHRASVWHQLLMKTLRHVHNKPLNTRWDTNSSVFLSPPSRRGQEFVLCFFFFLGLRIRVICKHFYTIYENGIHLCGEIVKWLFYFMGCLLVPVGRKGCLLFFFYYFIKCLTFPALWKKTTTLEKGWYSPLHWQGLGIWRCVSITPKKAQNLNIE